jgi:hypothetical protein
MERTRAAPGEPLRLGTRIKDEGLLEEALHNYGCRSVLVGETMSYDVEGRRLVFERSDEGLFEAIFVGEIPDRDARGFLDDLQVEYTHLVQQRVYENLLTRARERGLILESEEVREDNSIVVTLQVQEGR